MGTNYELFEKYFEQEALLLHHILCMANKQGTGDGYLVFGFLEKAVGIEHDKNRKTQKQMNAWLSDISFAGEAAPELELETKIIENCLVDIWSIKSRDKVPYVLSEDYCSGEYTLPAGRIYTRTEKGNTDIAGCAAYKETEMLWRRHFKIDPFSMEDVCIWLKKKEDFKKIGNCFYSMEHPDITVMIEMEERKRDADYYAYAVFTEMSYYAMLYVRYREKIVFQMRAATVDNERLLLPVPEKDEFLCNIWQLNGMEPYYYYIQDQIEYGLVCLLMDDRNSEQVTAMEYLKDLILIFETGEEKVRFDKYLTKKQSRILELSEQWENSARYRWISRKDVRKREEILRRLQAGKVLTLLLEEFRRDGEKRNEEK